MGLPQGGGARSLGLSLDSWTKPPSWEEKDLPCTVKLLKSINKYLT